MQSEHRNKYRFLSSHLTSAEEHLKSGSTWYGTNIRRTAHTGLHGNVLAQLCRCVFSTDSLFALSLGAPLFSCHFLHPPSFIGRTPSPYIQGCGEMAGSKKCQQKNNKNTRTVRVRMYVHVCMWQTVSNPLNLHLCTEKYAYVRCILFCIDFLACGPAAC